MADKKDRVIAIDYFRGLAMLAVILNHGAVFTYPYTYLVGEGRLWTGAAEMFFLLSGITLWIVRGDKLANDFKNVLIRSWKRAVSIYALSIIIAILSLSIAVFLTARNLPVDTPQAIPIASRESGVGYVDAQILLRLGKFSNVLLSLYADSTVCPSGTKDKSLV